MPGETSEGEVLKTCICTPDCTYRLQCVGSSPCQECAASKSHCIFNPCKDKRRKIAWKNTQELLMQLINILRHGTDDDVQHLREIIQQAASAQHAVECLHLSFPGYDIDYLKSICTRLIIILVIRPKPLPELLSE